MLVRVWGLEFSGLWEWRWGQVVVNVDVKAGRRGDTEGQRRGHGADLQRAHYPLVILLLIERGEKQ